MDQDIAQQQIDIDPRVVIRNLQQQRNQALDQAAELSAAVESQAETIKELRHALEGLMPAEGDESAKEKESGHDRTVSG